MGTAQKPIWLCNNSLGKGHRILSSKLNFSGLNKLRVICVSDPCSSIKNKWLCEIL